MEFRPKFLVPLHKDSSNLTPYMRSCRRLRTIRDNPFCDNGREEFAIVLASLGFESSAELPATLIIPILRFKFLVYSIQSKYHINRYLHSLFIKLNRLIVFTILHHSNVYNTSLLNRCGIAVTSLRRCTVRSTLHREYMEPRVLTLPP